MSMTNINSTALTHEVQENRIEDEEIEIVGPVVTAASQIPGSSELQTEIDATTLQLIKKNIFGKCIQEINPTILDAKALRITLSWDVRPHDIDVISFAGLLSKCVLLANPWTENCPTMGMVFEIQWTLTNTETGKADPTDAINVRATAGSFFTKLIHSPHICVVENAVRAPANIFPVEHKNMWNFFLSPCVDIAKPLANSIMMATEDKKEFFKNAALTINRVIVAHCRIAPKELCIQVASQCILAFAKVFSVDDRELERIAAAGLANCSQVELIEEVLKTGVFPKVVQLLKTENLPEIIVQRCFAIIKNTTKGTYSQVQLVLNFDVLPIIAKHLVSDNQNIRLFALSTLRNIASGTFAQIKEVVNAGIIPILLKMAEMGSSIDKSNAILVLPKINRSNYVGSFQILNKDESIRLLCQILTFNEEAVDALKYALVRIQTIVKEYSQGTRTLVECGGLGTIETLQEHADKFVSTLAKGVLKYFPVRMKREL